MLIYNIFDSNELLTIFQKYLEKEYLINFCILQLATSKIYDVFPQSSTVTF